MHKNGSATERSLGGVEASFVGSASGPCPRSIVDAPAGAVMDCAWTRALRNTTRRAWMHALFMAVSMFSTSSLYASEVRCDTCTTEASASVRARQVGVGLHYIYNVPMGLAWRFQVEREPAEGGTYDWFVYQESVEPEMQQLMSALATVHQTTSGTMTTIVELTVPPELGIGSAFDVARPGGARTALVDWANSPPTNIRNVPEFLFGAAHSVIAAVINVLKQVPVNALITIRFPDGSRVVIDYDILHEGIEYVEGSELDGAGNPIPHAANDFVGINFDFSRDFSGRSLERQLDLARQMGIPIVGSSGHRLACTGARDGIITCVRY